MDVDDRPAAESPDPVPAEDKVAAPQTPPGMPAADVTGEDDTAPQHQKIDAQMETASTPDPPEPEAVAASEESASEEPDGPLSANEEADAEGRPNGVVEDAERSAMPEPDSQAPDLTAPEERSTEAVAETAADTGEAAPPDQGETERLDAEVGTGAAATPPAAMAEGASGMDQGDPASDGAGREIVEEDLLTTEPSGSESPAAAVDDAVDAAAMPGGMPPADTGAADSSMASVSPDQDAAQPEVPAVLEARDKVRIAKNELRKKVAFIGFFSRAVNVDAKTKTALQDLLWPVFEKECRKDLMLMHRGDADYPAALDALMRDQFGHLNSFELTTVARFSGLNAIVAGTIIDIRVSKRLSGILWYKTPEGQLRLTILAEVFDAETGTKLLDHTYIREEEVEELEPGADEKLRKEDLPILEAALQSVAEEMGDHVCDALADQPWRAFVSGINGNRITLSSGQSAGLQPGNILGVYNSQIIDGLNNQQFFLTGEKMGRIQVINVHDDRSEALLIEGQGLRDYSVAIPE